MGLTWSLLWNGHLCLCGIWQGFEWRTIMNTIKIWHVLMIFGICAQNIWYILDALLGSTIDTLGRAYVTLKRNKFSHMSSSYQYQDVIQSLFKHMSLWCLLFDPHWTTYQSNLGNEPLKITSHLRPIYLMSTTFIEHNMDISEKSLWETCIFVWCVVRWEYENKHHRETCVTWIQLYLQQLSTLNNQHNLWEKGGYDSMERNWHTSTSDNHN
jgi:hypothetical protein